MKKVEHMYSELIKNAFTLVKQEIKSNVYGHDFWHIERVYKCALYIAQYETCDLFIVAFSAIFHDFYDDKFNSDTKKKEKKEGVKKFFLKNKISEEITDKIFTVINEVHFKGSHVDDAVSTKEAMIVQDADRLDALGAIGIARAFACGAYFNQNIYEPEIEPQAHYSFNEYRNNKTTTVNHFYEKLLRLKSNMKTEKGKEIAEERHVFMETYLEKFFNEWNMQL